MRLPSKSYLNAIANLQSIVRVFFMDFADIYSLGLLVFLQMASIQSVLGPLVGSKGNLSASKMPGISTTREKATSSYTVHLIPRATLTFDNSTVETTKNRPRKHTADPAAPDFLPLPSFEQCFPKSTKEFK